MNSVKVEFVKVHAVIVEEHDGKYGAYAWTMENNILGQWEIFRKNGVCTVQPVQSRRAAEALARQWNADFKANGTYDAAQK